MATTKEEVKSRVMQIINNDVQQSLTMWLDTILDSGVIDFDTEEDNWKLPKHIMVALGDKLSRSYTHYHPTKKDKAQIKNFSNLL